MSIYVVRRLGPPIGFLWVYSFLEVKLFITVGFDVLTTVVMTSKIWDITPCSSLSTDFSKEHIASIFRVEKISWARNQRESRLIVTRFHAGSLLSLFYYPEDGGDMFLRNIRWHSTNYTVFISQKMLPFLSLKNKVGKSFPYSPEWEL
jgi:hypothetical protein